MNGRSDNGAVVVAIGLILMLVLLLGGVAFYVVLGRQRTAMAIEADRAHLAEAQARIQAQQARAVADASIAVRTAADESESSTGNGESILAKIESVLSAQENALNRGDIDAFAEHYWNSDDVTFSSGGKTTRGWEQTVDGYRQRYPTPERMGRVKFSNIAITPLGDTAALVLGNWSLDRESDPLSGNFTLIFRNLDDRWVIIHDHTSRLTE